MKILQHNLDNLHVQLDVEVSEREVARAFDKAQVQFAAKMGLQAAPGLTPAKAAEEQLGIKDLDSVVRESVLEYLWPEALTQRNLQPAYPPKPVSNDALIRGKGYKFMLPVYVKPQYDLDSYEPITLDVKKPEIDYSGVDEVLKNLASQYTEYETDASGPPTVQSGDTLLLKMEMSHAGKPLKNLSFERRPYTLGQNYMPDGFDKNIEGTKIGSTKTFEFEAPAYAEDGSTQNNTFECTVCVLERQRAKDPEITDEWVRKYMPAYNSREELVSQIMAGQEQVQLDEYENELRSQATAKIADRFHGKIEDEVYEHMYANMLEQLKVQLSAQNITFDEYVEKMGGEEQMRMMMMIELRGDLVRGYALDAVFHHFKLKVGEEEINAVCKTLNPQNPGAVRDQMEGSGRGFALRESAQRYAASSYLVEHAIIETSETNKATEETEATETAEVNETTDKTNGEDTK